MYIRTRRLEPIRNQTNHSDTAANTQFALFFLSEVFHVGTNTQYTYTCSVLYFLETHFNGGQTYKRVSFSFDRLYL